MTRIGILSDTHGFLDPKVFTYFEECDEIWHAGDIGDISVCEALEKFKPLKAVYGNIDGHTIRAAYPADQFFKCEEVKVWITHIGGYPGHYAPGIRAKLMQHPPNLFVCGHSHILRVMNDKQLGFLHMNPGAAGNHGFHKVKTLLRFSIDGSRIFDLEVVEMGQRNII